MQIGNYYFDQNQAMDLLFTGAKAAAILLVTWLLAKVVKWTFAKLVDNIPLLQRGTSSGASVGDSIGKIASLFVWLFGLLGILQVFKLNEVSAPIKSLLTNIMNVVPNLLGAGILLFVGLIIAGIVRDIVVTAMQTLDLDKWANKGGVENVTGNNTISKTIGTMVYIFIAIPIAIGALGILKIAAISGPMTNMLQMILSALPNIIGASVLLVLGYFVSRFIANILTEILSGLGIDAPVVALGIVSPETKVSTVLARIAQIGIILFFAIAATKMLGFPELTAILDRILTLAGGVVFGAAVIGVGFLIANMLARFLGNPAGSIVRYVTMILFTFMGLRYMGIGEEIVDMAFGALVIGGAVAGALAFGLGGRDWAAKKLEQLDSGSDPKKPAAKAKEAPKSK